MPPSALILSIFASSALLGQAPKSTPTPAHIPQFEDFRVPTRLPTRQGPTYADNHVSDFEKEILKVAKEGPNFAGKFVIEQSSCGSGCTSFVIVNVQTSKIFDFDFNVAYSFCSQNYEPGSELPYRPDSKLLVVDGKIETLSPTMIDGPCGHFYYLWDGRTLKQIYGAVPATLKAPR